jgi:hypothetical protein
MLLLLHMMCRLLLLQLVFRFEACCLSNYCSSLYAVSPLRTNAAAYDAHMFIRTINSYEVFTSKVPLACAVTTATTTPTNTTLTTAVTAVVTAFTTAGLG